MRKEYKRLLPYFVLLFSFLSPATAFAEEAVDSSSESPTATGQAGEELVTDIAPSAEAVANLPAEIPASQVELAEEVAPQISGSEESVPEPVAETEILTEEEGNEADARAPDAKVEATEVKTSIEDSWAEETSTSENSAEAEEAPIKESSIEEAPTDDEKEVKVIEGARLDSTEGLELLEKEPDLTLDPEQLEDRYVRVVIELEGQSIIEEATQRGVSVDELDDSLVSHLAQALLADQVAIKQELTRSGIELKDSVEEDELVADASFVVTLNGFVSYIKASDIDAVANTPGVRAVYESIEYERPQYEVNMDTSNVMIHQPQAQELGYKGEGQVVAVIDSGTDPTHPDLQKLSPKTRPALTRQMVESLDLPGVYVNEKVPYAYNYFDQNTIYYDTAASGQHGQHVAGTVAANGLLQGVAPEAQILGLKVFSNDITSQTTFSDIYL